MTDKCPYHDDLRRTVDKIDRNQTETVRALATMNAVLASLSADLKEINLCLVGQNGLGGLVGAHNRFRGWAAAWGVIGGLSGTLAVGIVIVVIRYVL